MVPLREIILRCKKKKFLQEKKKFACFSTSYSRYFLCTRGYPHIKVTCMYLRSDDDPYASHIHRHYSYLLFFIDKRMYSQPKVRRSNKCLWGFILCFQQLRARVTSTYYSRTRARLLIV